MQYVQMVLAAVMKYGPWVATALLPTLIVGLSMAPKTEGAVSFLQKAIDVIKRVLYLISVSGYKNEARRLKLPLLHYTHKKPGPKAAGGPGCAALILFAASSFFMASCGCWTDKAKINTPACIVARQIVDCTVDSVKSQVGNVASNLIESYIQGNSKPDWDWIENKLISLGITDGGCILAQLKADFLSKPGAGPEYMAKAKMVSDGLERWKDKHNIKGVKFRVKRSDGKVVEL